MPEDDVQLYKENLPDILKTYDEKDIFNADETALYYRQLPGRTLEFNGAAAAVNKLSKKNG